MLVFDATPLIYLAKVDYFDVLDHLDDACVIPERVYEEVVTTGIEHGYPDARRIERAVEQDVFAVRPVEETDVYLRLQQNRNLSGADCAVLALASHTDGTAVMDEQYGRDVADTESIDTRGTAALLLTLVKRDVLAPDDARQALDEMVDAGWYCAPEIYARVLRTLESLS